MGEVYRARDELLARDVAIKVLPAEKIGDEVARARLLREARSAASLNHPHICTIYEVGESEGQTFIAMELIEGETLSGPLPKEKLAQYAAQIADALAHAHARGIIHRDLKCNNVMIGSDGRLKILDFGLAKRLDRAPEDGTTEQLITGRGAIVGTLAYMSPEQLRGATPDARSDIWALGVMLHELATGERPFKGDSQVQLVSSILNDPPPPQPLLRNVIARCLEKDPSRRYQTAGELTTALRGGGAIPWRAVAAAIVVIAIAAIAPFVKFPHHASKIESLAVLPLENLSGDANQEYFADGMTEALISDVGRVRGLSRVIARSSVMQFKGSKKPPSQIAKELNVDAIMTGSVIRAGDRVRVTAALVNPSTGAEMWSGRYERDLRDVLMLQNELTHAILAEVTGVVAPRSEIARQVDPGAYEDYLKGRFYWYRFTMQDFETARTYFESAIRKDANYAAAYVGLADAIGTPAHIGMKPSEGAGRARRRTRSLIARGARHVRANAFCVGVGLACCGARIQTVDRLESELSRRALHLLAAVAVDESDERVGE